MPPSRGVATAEAARVAALDALGYRHTDGSLIDVVDVIEVAATAILRNLTDQDSHLISTATVSLAAAALARATLLR